MRLYKFEFDFGRGYKGQGLFWSTENKIKRLIGKTINFGEICGKHSEVEVTVTEKMIADITEEIQNPDFSIGLQPLEYLPSFDFVIIPGGAKLSVEELENFNDPYELIELRSDTNYEKDWRCFYYDDQLYEVVDSKEEEGMIYFIAEVATDDN